MPTPTKSGRKLICKGIVARALNTLCIFFLFLVNMENLPNLLYSLAVDGNAKKEKGSRKKKKAIRKNGNEAKKKLR